MTTRRELEELLVRVEKATGPDREIDARLCVALLPEQWRADTRDIENGYAYELDDGLPFHKVRVPVISASTDAALALVGRCLPGWNWQVGDETRDGLAIWLGVSKANTVPLAILAALIKALLSESSPLHPKDGGR